MDDKNIFIAGANGQLGKALQAKFPKAKALDADGLDITDQAAVEKFNWSSIDIIINAAAYTDVDGAETAEGRKLAWQVNAVGAANLAQVATAKNLLLIHISTDYVFDGTKNPHAEDEPFSPLGVYGATKAAADLAVGLHTKNYILRTSFVIGEGKNFVRIMLELGKKGVNPSVIADQLGRVTFTSELVRAIEHLLQINAPFGTYNLSNSGEPVSWAALTREIFKLAGLNNTVTYTTTSEYYKDKPKTSPRPLNSVFDLSKIEATGFKPNDWRVDLKDYINGELTQ